MTSAELAEEMAFERVEPLADPYLATALLATVIRRIAGDPAANVDSWFPDRSKAEGELEPEDLDQVEGELELDEFDQADDDGPPVDPEAEAASYARFLAFAGAHNRRIEAMK